MKRTPLKRKSSLGRKRKKRARKSSLRQLKDKLWAECKRLTREKYGNGDGTFTCYTCDAKLDRPAKAQTGHFIPSSVCSTEMRYHLGNLRVQCYRCNINLSGNWIEYEKRLNEEMGPGYTDHLKQLNEDTKGDSYREDWYQAQIERYKQIDLCGGCY